MSAPTRSTPSTTSPATSTDDLLRNRLAEIQDLETSHRRRPSGTVAATAAEQRRRSWPRSLAELQADFIAANRDDLERFRRS